MTRSADGGDGLDAGDGGDNSRSVAARRRASRAHSGPGRTLLELVCPCGGFTGLWARSDLTRTGVLCCRVRSTTAFGGGGCSLPPAVVLLTPVYTPAHLRLADVVTATSVRR